MLIAGDPSGDQLAAELVTELRSLAPSSSFFAAGGPRLREAGVEMVLDLMPHAVIGLIEVIAMYAQFRRIFHELLELAEKRRPDVVIGVDYGGFNLRFAKALRQRAAGVPGWRPCVVQFVSPQVWASRPGRAQVLAQCHDLLLCILPFEKPWYAQHAPGLRVEFTGHPLVDRHAARGMPRNGMSPTGPGSELPLVVLLPGSRRGEMRRHWSVLREAAARIAEALPVRLLAILPTEELAALARADLGSLPELAIQVGGLSDSLAGAHLALASTGTVTLECAWFQVPTVALYRTSWSTYQIGKRIITVPYLAMPNLLANEVVMPEFIQDQATPENLSQAALAILRDPARHEVLRGKLRAVVAQLGAPGACRRAAGYILALDET